ncbi:hypothetical protein BYT27DRAFT_7203284 [Phlegmacium glaucopus]|nr:hypothetical protein BYT27DRAFT_7203284 [Phlegmacium glaucopus]
MSNFHVQSDFPFAFNCTGELLYGQMQCILEGLNNDSHDGMDGPVQRPIGGGTILQHDFQYRVAARVGPWKVSRVFVEEEDGSAPTGHFLKRQIAYVLHHEDVSAIEYVCRASLVGISRNKHDDKGIVYVNRYDWSWHHGKQESINLALDPSIPYTEEQISDLMGGRLFVVDSAKAQQFIQALSRFYPERKCYLLTDSPNDAPYGVHLDSVGFPEYELGWLGFSGKKHERFPDSDELVAMIYDPTYHGLDIGEAQAIMVEEMVARRGNDSL